MKKKWFKSKTIWANILSVGAVVIDHLAGTNIIPPKEATATIGIINVLLRLITKKPIN